MPTEEFTRKVDGQIPINIWDRTMDLSKLEYTMEIDPQTGLERKKYKINKNAWYICSYDVESGRVINTYRFTEGMEYIVTKYKEYTQRQTDLVESMDEHLEDAYNRRMLSEFGITPPEPEPQEPADVAGLSNMEIKFVSGIAKSVNMHFNYVKEQFIKIGKNMHTNLLMFTDACFLNAIIPALECSRSLLNSMYDWTVRNPVLSKVILLSPLIVIAWRYIQRELVPEASGDSRLRRAKKLVRVVKPITHLPVLLSREAELNEYSQNTEDTASAIVEHNLFNVFTNYLYDSDVPGRHDGKETFDEHYHKAYTMLIVDTLGIGNVHLVEFLDNRLFGCEELHLKPDNDLSIWLCNAKYPKGWTLLWRDAREKVFQFPESLPDRCYLPLKPWITERRARLNIFAPSTHPAFTRPFGGMLILTRHDIETNELKILFPSGRITVTGPISWGSYKTPMAFEYDFAKNINRDCGAPLILCDSEYPICHIVGTHASGHTVEYGPIKVKHGNALPIFREEIEAALAYIGCLSKDVDTSVCRKMELSCDLLDGFPIHDITVGISTPERSMYKKSKLFEKFGPTPKVPAICTQENLAAARNKYSPNMPPMDDACLDAVTTNYIAKLANRVDLTDFKFMETEKDLLTVEEAVLPFGSVPAINRQTGACFPESLKGKKKHHLFGSSGDYEFISDDFIRFANEIRENNEMMLEGIMPLFIFTDFAKDETLPNAKVLVENPWENGKNRMVSGADVHLTVNTRQTHLPIMDRICSQPFAFGIAMGVNPASSDWTTLVNNLLSVGINILAIDHKGWDTNFRCHLMYYVNKIYLELFFHKRDMRLDKLLNCLHRALANPLHLATIKTILTEEVLEFMRESKILMPEQLKRLNKMKPGDEVLLALLYEMYNSMSSGSPRTTPDNSFGNHLSFFYVIVKVIINGRAYYARCVDFDLIFNNVYIMALGDDVVASIGQPLVDLGVTPEAIRAEYARIGMTITDDVKSDGLMKYRDISEVTFLSRRFIYDPILKVWLAALALDSIYASLYWVRLNVKEEDFRLVVQNAIIELSAWGYDIFMIRAPPILVAAWVVLGYYVPIRTWKDAVAAFRSLNLYQQ